MSGFFAIREGAGAGSRLAARMCLAIAVMTGAAAGQERRPPPWKSGIKWDRPKVVAPGPVGGSPSDAIVLFDGKDLSKWQGGEAWVVKDGYVECHRSAIRTKQAFGDCQLHIEWATPAEVKGEGQGRGNSGVYLMGRYELQILDSYQNETYYDGQAGAIYKQKPPLVNVSRKPGEWQSYDIIFRGPRFNEKGELTRSAYATVLHNGVLIQDHFELAGGTFYRAPPSYKAHSRKAPLRLQNHGNPLRFRNIWIRELPEEKDRLGFLRQPIATSSEK